MATENIEQGEAMILLSDDLQHLLCCPICKMKLEIDGQSCRCVGLGCGTVSPVVNGIPILINDDNSLFCVDDFVDQRDTLFDLQTRHSVRKLFSRIVPSISANITAKRNYDRLGRLLIERFENPKVLVVGGRILGAGLKSLLAYSSIDVLDSDVSFGPRTKLICDAHDIPFVDESFDCVIAQAVLEHVADPHRCVAEIRRVLKPEGIVYAETPFMQQVHGGAYDFTRFTHQGHRRLFRWFDELDSGACCGPGMALALSYQNFLMSLGRGKLGRELIAAFARCTAWHLKYFDYLVINRPAARDAASGYYYMGVKSDEALSDRELLERYNGSCGNSGKAI